MADPDTFAGAGPPDAAGWVLGVLDPEESGRFETHLESCPECQQAVAEFGIRCAPADVRPAGRAAGRGPRAAAGPAGPDPGQSVRGGQQSPAQQPVARRPTRMLALAASVLVAAGIAIGLLLSGGAPAGAYALTFHLGTGLSASASGTVRCRRLTAAGRCSSPQTTCPSRGRGCSISAGGSGRETGPVIPAGSARAPLPSARPGPRPYRCGPRPIRTASQRWRSPWTMPPSPASQGGSSCPAPSTTTADLRPRPSPGVD